jgi:hypothetical protein
MLQVMPNVTIQTEDGIRKYKNKMTQKGLDWLLDLAAGLAPSGITHIAVGDGTAVVSLGDLQLGNELARKAVTAISRDTGTALAEVFFDKTEANFTWKEIGLFTGGTDVANSGTLIARALVNEAKDSRRTATIAWEIGLANA